MPESHTWVFADSQSSLLRLWRSIPQVTGIALQATPDKKQLALRSRCIGGLSRQQRHKSTCTNEKRCTKDTSSISKSLPTPCSALGIYIVYTKSVPPHIFLGWSMCYRYFSAGSLDLAAQRCCTPTGQAKLRPLHPLPRVPLVVSRHYGMGGHARAQAQ